MGTQWSQVSSVDMNAQLVLAAQVVIAAALGAAVGLERELAGKRAGTRTHVLAAVGAALAVGLGRVVLGPDAAGDPTRVLHGVVTGIGFIGAGAILHSREHGKTTGLTTAATVLCVAVLGAACALGAPLLAAAVTVLVLAILQGARVLARLTDAVVERRRASGAADDDD